MGTQQIRVPSSNPDEWLEFSHPEPPDGDGPVQAFVLTVQLADLRASTRVDLSHYNSGVSLARDLADVFDEMAAHWRGWAGRKEWAALESPVELAFVHDGVGAVRAQVTMSRDFHSRTWEVRSDLYFELGSLTRTARGVREFLRVQVP